MFCESMLKNGANKFFLNKFHLEMQKKFVQAHFKYLLVVMTYQKKKTKHGKEQSLIDLDGRFTNQNHVSQLISKFQQRHTRIHTLTFTENSLGQPILTSIPATSSSLHSPGEDMYNSTVDNRFYLLKEAPRLTQVWPPLQLAWHQQSPKE